MPRMDGPPELLPNEEWPMAIWALHVGVPWADRRRRGPHHDVAGIHAVSPAVGLIIWLAAAAVTLTPFFWARHELPAQRPG
jgi:hypothetical protein